MYKMALWVEEWSKLGHCTFHQKIRSEDDESLSHESLSDHILYQVVIVYWFENSVRAAAADARSRTSASDLSP